MKKLIIAGIVALFATNVNADSSYTTEGIITDIQPIKTRVNQQRPVEKCQDVEVPIYGRTQNGDAGANALAGMIIGGLLGKGVTGDDGGAAAGAVIGGVIGANNSQGNRVITGYRQERQCQTTYRNVNVHVVNEYDITYRIDRQRITIRVNRAVGERAWIGQTKNFRVRYQLLN
jgi:uncharacterized protein YcfJ